jgi:hypothetical protein
MVRVHEPHCGYVNKLLESSLLVNVSHRNGGD